LLLHPLATQDLGSLAGNANNLSPGVYTFSASTSLLGALTLNAGGAINPVFVFLIPASLTAAANSSVFVNPGGVNGGRDAGIFWVTDTGAVSLGQDSAFEGNILAGSAITFDPGAQIVCGRAFAQTAVSFAGVSPTPQNNRVDSLDCTGTAGQGSPTDSSGFSGGLEYVSPGPPETFDLALIQEGGGPGPGVGAPEPSSLLLLAGGLIGVAARMRRARAR
jgi:hypothetical protein